MPTVACEEVDIEEVLALLAREGSLAGERYRQVEDLQVALQSVASERDRRVFLEVAVQAASGDPSPANTVAQMFGLQPAAVRADPVPGPTPAARLRVRRVRRTRRRPRRSGARRMTDGRARRPLDGALDRHPAGRDRRRDLLRLARVVARRLEHDGAAHPAVGAAALASRGVRADDRVRRAAAWGLTDALPGRRRGRRLSGRVGAGTAAPVEPVRRAARRARARRLVMPSPGGESALGTFAATVEQGSRDGARSPGCGGEGQG